MNDGNSASRTAACTAVFSDDYATSPGFRQDEICKLPIALKAHHALVSGVHVVCLLEQLAHECRQPVEAVDEQS